MRSLQKLVFTLAIAGIIVAFIFGIGGYWNKQTVTVKVTDKERITQVVDGTSNSYYLIYSEAGTFKLEDDLFYGNFNSSDWYGQIKKDSTYTFDLVGYRVGFLSSYPNIVKFKK